MKKNLYNTGNKLKNCVAFTKKAGVALHTIFLDFCENH